VDQKTLVSLTTMALKKSENVLEQGDQAPSFNLEDYRQREVSLSDLDNYDGVLLVFICNHCPYVKAQTEEIRELTEEFSSIAFVGVNPNADTHPGDSVDKMEDFVEENDLDTENFYYLVDRDQDVSEAYGAACTPDPFLLDWRHKLYYHGRLNDMASPDEELTEREMRNVIKRMLKRETPPEDQEPPQGCGIKWKE